MKNNLKINKSKLYHKLINNKVVYNNKPISRQKKSVTIRGYGSQNKIQELENLKKRMESAGFISVKFKNLFDGIVSIHTGFK